MVELCCEHLSVRCIWLYVIIMSRTSFRVNLHSIVRLRAKCLRVRTLFLSHKLQIWRLNAKEFLDIQANRECRFTLKLVCDMIITYSQMHHTDKYSQHSSIIWPVCLNGWVFVYELSGCGFESRSSQLNFRYDACFEQGVSWQSGNY